MLAVGLTGGIATGKSYVSARLRAHGVPVVDADALAHAAVAAGTVGLAAVSSRFGPRSLRADGTLDRAWLGAVVFRDPGARRDLEAIVHPAVRAAIIEFFAQQPPGTPLAVADIPLLFETGRSTQPRAGRVAGARRHADFDLVVVVACAPETQIARVMVRDGLSRADAELRVAAQLPIVEKVARADYVINTEGSFADTNAQVDHALTALRQRAITAG